MPQEVGQKFDKSFVKTSFYYSLRVMATSVRSEKAAEKFMEDKKWSMRLLEIVSQWRDKEVVANSARIVNRILRFKESSYLLLAINPKLASTLLLAMAQHIENKAALLEMAEALRKTTVDMENVRHINPSELNVLY